MNFWVVVKLARSEVHSIKLYNFEMNLASIRKA